MLFGLTHPFLLLSHIPHYITIPHPLLNYPSLQHAFYLYLKNILSPSFVDPRLSRAREFKAPRLCFSVVCLRPPSTFLRFISPCFSSRQRVVRVLLLLNDPMLMPSCFREILPKLINVCLFIKTRLSEQTAPNESHRVTRYVTVRIGQEAENRAEILLLVPPLTLRLVSKLTQPVHQTPITNNA